MFICFVSCILTISSCIVNSNIFNIESSISSYNYNGVNKFICIDNCYSGCVTFRKLMLFTEINNTFGISLGGQEISSEFSGGTIDHSCKTVLYIGNEYIFSALFTLRKKEEIFCDYSFIDTINSYSNIGFFVGLKRFKYYPKNRWSEHEVVREILYSFLSKVKDEKLQLPFSNLVECNDRILNFGIKFHLGVVYNKVYFLNAIISGGLIFNRKIFILCDRVSGVAFENKASPIYVGSATWPSGNAMSLYGDFGNTVSASLVVAYMLYENYYLGIKFGFNAGYSTLNLKFIEDYGYFDKKTLPSNLDFVYLGVDESYDKIRENNNENFHSHYVKTSLGVCFLFVG